MWYSNRTTDTSIIFGMSLFSNLHLPVIQRNNTICSSKRCSKNGDANYWMSARQKQCVCKVKELRNRLRNCFENSESAGRIRIQNKHQAKDFSGKYDCVPPCPRIKKFKLLKIAVVVSTGIYVGDVIGKSFQDTILSLRDELWYPYEDWFIMELSIKITLLINVNFILWGYNSWINLCFEKKKRTSEYVFYVYSYPPITWRSLTEVSEQQKRRKNMSSFSLWPW
jgi:hypothetical protein